MTQVSPHMQMFGMDIANDPEALGGPDVENDDSLLMEGIKDVPRGIAGGVIGFGQSLGDLADTGLEQIGIDIADDSMWSKQARPEWAQTKTIFGGVVEGMTQAALAFVPVAGIAGKASQALRGTQLISRAIETGGLTARAASILTSRGLVGGAIVDAYAFKGDEGHFADLMVSLGGPGDNPVTRWLSSQEDDTWLEGRAKNVVEGALLGIGWDAVVEPLMKAFKGKPDWDSKGLFQDPKGSAERGLIPPKLAEELGTVKWESFSLPETGQRQAFQEQLRAATGDDQVTSAVMALSDAFVKNMAFVKGISVDEAYGQVFAGVNRVGDPIKDATKQIQYDRLLAERILVDKTHPLFNTGKPSDAPGRNQITQPNLKSILPNPTSVWHQTTPENAAKIFNEMKKPGSQWESLFVSDNKDLAIGQGKSGVTIEFDPERLNGFKHEKPGTFLDGAEYRVTKGSPGAIKNILFDTPKAEQAFAKKYPNLYEEFKGRANAPRGAVSFTEDGKAIITLMRNSDPSTVVHEMGHVFRRQLREISGDLAAQADQWVGAEPGAQWTRDQEERWAQTFEKYLADGQAPTPELKSVFERFASWLKDVYRGIIGGPLKTEVSPQIRNVFDAMLGNGWNRFDPSASRPLEVPSNRPMQALRDLRGTQPTRYVDVDAEDLARARQPPVTGGFLHTEAYKAFDAELPVAFEKIKQAGIEVVPWTKNTPPYESVQALQADISTNKRVFVPNGDPLTAVRMVFGHAADGYRFDDRGIENSYRALEGMFSEQARPALAGQVRGTALGAPSGPRGIITLYQDPKEVLGTFEKALKANDDPMAAGIDTISYHVNHGRFEMKNSSRAVLEVADKVSEEMLNRKIGDVKTQAQVLSEAQELVKNPDALIKDAETLAKAIGNMDSMKIALDLSVASASDQLATGVRNLNELVKAGGEQALTVANANDLYDLMDTLWRFSTASGTIQKTAARTTAAGNIKIDLDGQSYDLSELGKGNPDRATLIDAATKVAEKEGLPSEAVKDWIKEPGNPRKPSSSPTIDSGARSDTGGGPTRAPEDVPVNESNGDSVVDPKNRPVIPDRGAPEFDFTPEAKKKFIKLLEELSMAVSTNQTGKTLDRMKKAHRAGVFSAFMEVHKASLLSGIPTLVLNVTSPAYQAMAQPVAKILGSLVQMNPAGAKEGTRLLFNTVGSLFDVVHATFNAPDGPGSKGLKPSFNIFNTEKPGLTGASGVSEHRHVITAENFGVDPTTVRGRVLNKVGRFVRLPFTASAVAEDMWNQVTYLAYVKTKAAMEADRIWDDASLSNDIKPALVAEYIQQRVSGAFDEFGRAVVGNDGLFKHDDAIRYAKSVNFTTELGKGTIGDSLMGMKAKHPSLDLVIPFLRVPLNLTRTAIRYTPLLGQLHDHMLSKHLSRNADEVARVKGEMVMGTALWGTAIYLASSGQITGGGPTNKAERDALLATGWRPYSLVSTDESGKTRYIEFRRFDPLATIYGLAADFSDMGQYLSDEDKDGLASVMVMALANNITSKTYLQGIADVSRALTGGTTTGSFLRSKAASLVPNIAARYASADDVYMREARTVLDAFKRRIPGFSDTLPPRRDILGSPMTPPPGYMPFVDTSRPGLANNVSQFASPVAMNTKTSDVVRLEMANLKHGFSPPPVKMNGVDLTLLKNRNGQDAYDRLMELTGEIKIGSKDVHAALDELVRSDYYKRLPAPDGRDDNDNARIRAMTKVLSRYRQAARLQVMREFPELKAAATGQGRPTLTSRDNPILQALNR